MTKYKVSSDRNGLYTGYISLTMSNVELIVYDEINNDKLYPLGFGVFHSEVQVYGVTADPTKNGTIQEFPF